MIGLTAAPITLVHVGFSGLALVTGTWVVLNPKGTRRHRWLGYAYVASMSVVLTTAFGIYHLFGRFGIVHWGAVGSWLVLVGGLWPVWLRSRMPSWLFWHQLSMGLSVAGLYATFLVESTYRLFPARYFWFTTVGTSTLVLLAAIWLLYKQLAPQLTRRYSLPER
ncbi:hypothetical protein J2I47_10875 [Fibrella sp. HMF5335]|uniref:DUF2306 domain-containing protein n=1 Tax=Fibrella rubiginis TaxID=2817060 RepID=A0A939GFW5_9BACT|nr:hypothetical protein [Fibrella rubiginis]MBO0937048.1 hypothetical protein [Fibrella rubiginis]